MGKVRLCVLSLVVILLLGCGSEPEDAFFVQPEWAGYKAGVPEELGYNPTLTSWHRVESMESAPDICTTPQKTTEAWAAMHNLVGSGHNDSLNVSIQVRPEDNSNAIGLVQRWGFKDDSVAGTDHRVALQRSNGCWRVTDAQTRLYCRRGADSDGRCL